MYVCYVSANTLRGRRMMGMNVIRVDGQKCRMSILIWLSLAYLHMQILIVSDDVRRQFLCRLQANPLNAKRL